MRTRAQYKAFKKSRPLVGMKARIRNPSKATIKKIMRRAYAAHYADGWQWNPGNENNYFLFNAIGARLYIMSKGRICNREPRGYDFLRDEKHWHRHKIVTEVDSVSDHAFAYGVARDNFSASRFRARILRRR